MAVSNQSQKLTATMVALCLYLLTDNGVSSAQINNATKTTLGRDAWRNLRDVVGIKFTFTEHKISKNGTTATYKRGKITTETQDKAIAYFRRNVQPLIDSGIITPQNSEYKTIAQAYIHAFKTKKL